MDDLIKLRDIFKIAIDIMDQMIKLKENESNEKMEELAGKLLVQMLKMQSLV